MTLSAPIRFTLMLESATVYMYQFNYQVVHQSHSQERNVSGTPWGSATNVWLDTRFELIRFWGSKVKGHCDLTKQGLSHDDKCQIRYDKMMKWWRFTLCKPHILYVEALHFLTFSYVVIWLGLGPKPTWKEFGKDHVLAWNTCFGYHKQAGDVPWSG